jgi:hypothetical protein
MGNTHDLKTDPEVFDAVRDGVKNFEIRKDDRGFDVGDELVLQEWCPLMGSYTGREVVRFVRFILRDFEGLQPGYVAMSLQFEPF